MIETSSVRLLANRLEDHIRTSGLGPGDRYLTAAEAGELLTVSTATAHRAMKTLADRRVLIRHTGRGTFVGAHFGSNRRLKIRTVYALVQSQNKLVADFPFDLFTRGIRSSFHDANVQLSFLPPGPSVEYVKELIRSAKAAGEVGGMVPISCPREVYRCLAHADLPVVIFGSPYADQQGVASVDVDNHESGRLLTRRLLERGHRRMVLLSFAEGRPGDNDFFDGVSEELTAAELPHNSLVVRIVPHDAGVFTAQLRQLLEAPDHPTGLIARCGRLASAAGAAVSSVGHSAAGQIEIVFQDHPPTTGNELPYTCVRPRLSFQETAVLIGEMLDRLSGGEPLEQERVVVPVQLQQPLSERR